MIYVFDLDGVICTEEKGSYSKCEPIQKNIDIVNDLHKANTVILQSARHGRWWDFTEKQLSDWEMHYDLLSLGEKIPADVYVDDKAINSKEFFGE